MDLLDDGDGWVANGDQCDGSVVVSMTDPWCRQGKNNWYVPRAVNEAITRSMARFERHQFSVSSRREDAVGGWCSTRRTVVSPARRTTLATRKAQEGGSSKAISQIRQREHQKIKWESFGAPEGRSSRAREVCWRQHVRGEGSTYKSKTRGK